VRQTRRALLVLVGWFLFYFCVVAFILFFHINLRLACQTLERKDKLRVYLGSGFFTPTIVVEICKYLCVCVYVCVYSHFHIHPERHSSDIYRDVLLLTGPWNSALVGQLLPTVFKSHAWGILHTLLEMFSHRMHHIQPHYRVQLLSHLHTLAAVAQTNQNQLHLW
jgi:hypothetical protein